MGWNTLVTSIHSFRYKTWADVNLMLALAKLVKFALPNLRNFTLWVWPDNHLALCERDVLREIDPLQSCDPMKKSVHLCPLFREFGKDTPYIDIFLPFVCRELFLTVNERAKLSEADVKRAVGTRDGGKTDDALDVNSTVAIVKEHRKAVAHASFQAAVKENITEAKKEGKNKIVTLAEYDINQKNLKRERLIKSEKWKRVVRCGQRLCRSNESWEELEVLAGLEEENVTWVLGRMLSLLSLSGTADETPDERLNTASTFTGGSSFGINEKQYDEQFPMPPGSECAARVAGLRGGHNDGIDFNDHMR